jgi:hypothetical protein
MGAEVALGCGTVIGVHVDRVVGTGLHTSLAADAAFGIKIHDAIFTFVHRRDRANGYARRLLAMVAASDLEEPASVGIFALLNVLDPGAVHAQRHLVLGLAGDGASVAPNALAIIDDESVIHREGDRPEGVCAELDFARRFTAISSLTAWGKN